MIVAIALANCVPAHASRVTASAGFDPTDATSALQSAIDSKADTVIVPKMSSDWIVTPIFLRVSNQTVIFQPGVAVVAKRGEFQDPGECLMTINASNVTLIGYGATLRMWKSDYINAPYVQGEHRHCLNMESGNSNIQVLGLNLLSSGGDGLYIRRLKNILIQDVTCDSNYRQGISIIAAENMVIKDCVILNTTGTAPQYGIDIEPNASSDYLTNCVIRNCYFEGNAQFTVGFVLNNLDSTNDITFSVENCWLRGGSGGRGIAVAEIYKTTGPQGSIAFKNCYVEDTYASGLGYYNVDPYQAQVTMDNVVWRNVNYHYSDPPFFFSESATDQLGGLRFTRCYLDDAKNRAFMTINAPVANIKGDITVADPYGAKYTLGTTAVDCSLQVIERKSPVKSTVKIVAAVPVTIEGQGSTAPGIFRVD
jgi:polygalacturonase